jgi:hypothetical protein
VSFWLAYLDVCRAVARANRVSLRTLDKALWPRSKELGAEASGPRRSRRRVSTVQ